MDPLPLSSSLKFDYALRQEVDSIQAICLLKATGNFVTYDTQAMRLWSMKKHLKSSRALTKEQNLSFLGMECFDKLECIITLHSVRAKGEEKGGVIQLISFNLLPLQEIKLDYPVLTKYSFSPLKTELILLDKNRFINAIHFEDVSESNLDQTSISKKPSSKLIDKRKDATNTKKTKKLKIVELRTVQQLDLTKKHVQDIVFCSENRFLVLTKTSIKLFSRDSLIFEIEETQAEKRKRQRRSRAQAALGPDVLQIPNQTLDDSIELQSIKYNEFQQIHQLPMNYRDRGKTPVLVEWIDKDRFLVGFKDGDIQIIVCPEILMNKIPKKNGQINRQVEYELNVLCEFTAHSSKTFRGGILTACLAPWPPTSGGKGYVLELLTVGSDRRLAHWGVRYKPGGDGPDFFAKHKQNLLLTGEQWGTGKILGKPIDEESLGSRDSRDSNESVDGLMGSAATAVIRSACPMEADMLGEHTFQVAFNPKTKGFKSKIPFFYTPKIHCLELSIVDAAIQRKVVFPFDCRLLFLDVLQPFRVVGELRDKYGKRLDVQDPKALSQSRDIEKVTPAILTTAIISSARGPDIIDTSFANSRFLMGDLETKSEADAQPDLMPFSMKPSAAEYQSTIVHLKESTVDVVSVATGETLQTMTTLHLRDVVIEQQLRQNQLTSSSSASTTSKSLPSGVAALNRQQLTLLQERGLTNGTGLPHTMTSIADQYMQQVEARALEGDPTVVHWCSMSHLLLVGFSSGGVGVINMEGTIVSTQGKAPFTHLLSGERHRTAISFIGTTAHRLMRPTAATPVEVVLALVGDTNGVISVWQLTPPSGSYSPLLCRVHNHVGKILFAHSCLLDVKAGHRVVVTACAGGTVKAWKLEPHGELTIMAFAQSMSSYQAKMTSIAVLPSVVVPPPDDKEPEFDHAQFSLAATEVLVKPKKQKVEADFNYEIHCICGFSDGRIESWLLSTNPLRSSSSELDTLRINVAPVTAIAKYASNCNYQTLVKNPCESVFLPFAFLGHEIVCCFQDGTFVTVTCGSAGKFTVKRYSAVPGPLHSIIPVTFRPWRRKPEFEEDSVPEFECVLVGDFVGYEILQQSPVEVPEKWQNYYLPPNKKHSTRLSSFKIDSHKHLIPLIPYAAGDGNNPAVVPPDSPLNLSGKYDLMDYEPFHPGNNSLGQLDESDHFVSHISYTDSETQPLFRTHTGGSTADSQTIDSNEQISNPSSAVIHNDNASVPSVLTSAGATVHTLDVGTMKNQLVGPMDPAQRAASTELHLAKKDARLLKLFTQLGPAIDGTISPAETVDIVFAWVEPTHIKKDNIWELFKLLEVGPDDRLKFIEVAKIASFISSAMKRYNYPSKETKQPRKIPAKYGTLKSKKTKVSYNSMGERVLEKMEFDDSQLGIFDGTVEEIKALWKDQTCRVITREESKQQLPPSYPVLLEKVPDAFLALAPHGFKTPKVWDPTQPHWFDPRRVVRIARTLMDIRSTRQHETFRSNSLFQASSRDVDSLPVIVVRYFERNFGDISKLMNISRLKVAYFLEACLQYQHHPIVNILKTMLDLDSGFDKTFVETATWLCVEARSTMCYREQVITGEYIQPYDSSYNYPEIRVKDGPPLKVRWQCVTRASALQCADEMFRERGKFGPVVYQAIHTVVEELPSVEGSGESFYDEATGMEIQDPTSLIDFERFLEVLFFEYLRVETERKQAELFVFGDNAVPLAVTAKPRNINDTHSQRRPLVMDDQDFQYGPHHALNMARIRKLLSKFMPHDPLRTGGVKQSFFVQAIHEAAVDLGILGAANSIPDTNAFIEYCLQRFRGDTPDSDISYMELVGQLLAWAGQTQGSEMFDLKTMLKSLGQVERGMEYSQAEHLVNFFNSSQSLSSLDPIWTMGENNEGGNPYASQVNPEGSFTVSHVGSWNADAVPAVEQPGLFYVQKEPIQRSNKVPKNSTELVARRKPNKLSDEHEPVSPKILVTDREFFTLRGEALRTLVPHELPTLSQTDLDPEHIPPVLDLVVEDNMTLSRGSFSRSMQRLKTLDTVPSFTDTFSPSLTPSASQSALTSELSRKSDEPPPDNEAPLMEGEMKGGQSINDSLDSYGNQKDKEVPGLDLLQWDVQSETGQDGSVVTQETSQTKDSNYQNYSVLLEEMIPKEPLLNDELNQVLAEDDVESRIQARRLREQQWEVAFRQEKDLFAARRAAKEALRDQIYREMKQKERESMAFYRQAVDQRFERTEKGRQQYQKNLTMEEEDKKAKDKEIERLAMENRMRIELGKSNKLNAIEEAKLDRLRKKDRTQMEKEDARSAAMNKNHEEMLRMKEELKKKQEQEKFELKMREIREARRLIERQAEEEANALAEAEELAAEKAAAEAAAAFAVATINEEIKDGENDENVDAQDVAEDDDNDVGENQESIEGSQKEDVSLVESNEDKNENDAGGMNDEESVAAEDLWKELEELPQKQEENEEENLDPYAEMLRLEKSRPVTAAEQRMLYFSDRVRTSTANHQRHPRRKNGKFFMPLAFSDDIYFDPFEADCPPRDFMDDFRPAPDLTKLTHDLMMSSLGQEMLNEEIEEKDDFHDIKVTVKKYKKDMEAARKLLFTTSLDDIASKDWMQMYRKAVSDWDKFFTMEKIKLETAKVIPVNAEAEFEFNLDEIESGRNSERSSVFSQLQYAESGAELSQPFILAKTPETEQYILNLNLGKILGKQIVLRGTYRYFQFEQKDPKAELIFDIKCHRGLAHLYISFDKLPSTVEYEHHVRCTEENMRLGRIAYFPRKKGIVYVAVRSPSAGALFDIKASTSVEPMLENATIARVNRTLRKFELLNSTSLEEMEIHFPRLFQEAHLQSEKEYQEREKFVEKRRILLAEMQAIRNAGHIADDLFAQPSGPGDHESVIEVNEDDTSDLDSLDNSTLDEPNANTPTGSIKQTRSPADSVKISRESSKRLSRENSRKSLPPIHQAKSGQSSRASTPDRPAPPIGKMKRAISVLSRNDSLRDFLHSASSNRNMETSKSQPEFITLPPIGNKRKQALKIAGLYTIAAENAQKVITETEGRINLTTAKEKARMQRLNIEDPLIRLTPKPVTYTLKKMNLNLK